MPHDSLAERGSVTYHCSGTVSLLAGTDMHQILNTGMTLTSIGVGLLITIAERIGLQVLSSLFTSCISAGQALMWGGAAPAALATEVEMTATSAVAAGVDAEVEGAAVAVTTAAAASSVGAFVGPIVGLIGFAASVLMMVFEKTLVHWIDVYNLTEMDLTVTEPWDYGASFQLKPDPNVIPAATTDSKGNHLVSYSSYCAQNSDSFKGFNYMVQVAPSNGGDNILATININHMYPNTMALDQIPAGAVDGFNYQNNWNNENNAGFQEVASLTQAMGSSGFDAILTINAMQGSNDQYKGILYIVDYSKFPDFQPGSTA